MDGTCADTLEEAARFVNKSFSYNDMIKNAPEEFKKFIHPEKGICVCDFHSPPVLYDYFKFLNKFGGWSWIELAKPIPGSIEAIEKLIADGNEVFIVSSLWSEAYLKGHAALKARWIKKNVPFVDIDHFVCCHEKWLLNVDIMIDDLPEHVIRSNDLLFQRPWNKSFWKSKKSFWSWEAIPEIIRRVRL